MFFKLKSKNKAFTLIEILLMTSLLILIVLQIWNMQSKFLRIQDYDSKLIGLQNGVRNVVENMVQDINASIAFLNVSNDKMILARFKSAVNDDFIAVNGADVVFPYYMDQQPTSIFTPCLFVEYKLEGGGQIGLISQNGSNKNATIVRKVKEGQLKSEDTGGEDYILDTFSIHAGASDVGVPKVMAKKVSVFQLDYYGYDDQTGQLVTIGAFGDDKMAAAKAAMVAVHIAAEDPYADANLNKTPKMEIYTKIWSQKMVSENQYPQYFGHFDRDLKF
ncbi:MAG: hypothetical protein COB02_04845 [Candidatus Cloacimonadota bacterium]|nr:MAG: hypothetical protein COB02_04845 [Candidatus Cloacimonadota bacterium]